MEAGVLYDPTVSSCELSKKGDQKFRHASNIANDFSVNFLRRLSKNNTPDDLPFTNDPPVASYQFRKTKLEGSEREQLFSVLLNGVSDDLVSQAVHDTNSKDHFGTSAPPPSAVRVANAIASVWKDATFRWDGTPLIHTHSLFGLRAILERDKIVVVDAEERKKKAYHLSVIRPLYFTMIRTKELKRLKPIISKFVVDVVDFPPLFSFVKNSSLYIAYRTQEQAQIIANIVEISFFSAEMEMFSLGEMNVRCFIPGIAPSIVSATTLQQKPSRPAEILSCRKFVLAGVKDFSADFFKRSFENVNIEKVQPIPESISPAVLLTCVSANAASLVCGLLHIDDVDGAKCTVLPLIPGDPLYSEFDNSSDASSVAHQMTPELRPFPSQQEHCLKTETPQDKKAVGTAAHLEHQKSSASHAPQSKIENQKTLFVESVGKHTELGNKESDRQQIDTNANPSQGPDNTLNKTIKNLQSASKSAINQKTYKDCESNTRKSIPLDNLAIKKIKEEPHQDDSLSEGASKSVNQTVMSILIKKESKSDDKNSQIIQQLQKQQQQQQQQQQQNLSKSNIESNKMMSMKKSVSSNTNESSENKGNTAMKTAKLVYLKRVPSNQSTDGSKRKHQGSTNSQTPTHSTSIQSVVPTKAAENTDTTTSMPRQAKVQTILCLAKEPSMAKLHQPDDIKLQAEEVSSAANRISCMLDNLNAISASNGLLARSPSTDSNIKNTHTDGLSQLPVTEVQLPYDFAAAVTGSPTPLRQDASVRKMLVESEALIKIKGEKHRFFNTLNTQAAELEKNFKESLADSTKARLLQYKIDWLKKNIVLCKDAPVQLKKLQTEYNTLSKEYFTLAFDKAKVEVYDEALADLAKCVCAKASVKVDRSFGCKGTRLVEQFGKILYDKFVEFSKSMSRFNEKEGRASTSSKEAFLPIGKMKRLSAEDAEKLREFLVSCIAKQIKDNLSDSLSKKVPTFSGNPSTVLTNIEHSFRQKVYGFAQTKLSIFELKKQYDVSLMIRTKLDELEEFNEQLNKIDEVVYTHAPTALLSESPPDIQTVCFKDEAQKSQRNSNSDSPPKSLEPQAQSQNQPGNPNGIKRKNSSLCETSPESLPLQTQRPRLDCEVLERCVEKLYREWGEFSRGKSDALFSRLLLLAGREGYLYDQELSFLRLQHDALLQKLRREFETQETVRALQQENRECIRLIKMNLSRDTDNYANALRDKLLSIFYCINSGTQPECLPDSLHQIVDVVLSDKSLARALLASVLTSNLWQFNVATNKLQRENSRGQNYLPTNEQVMKRRHKIYTACKKRLLMDQQRAHYALLRFRLELSRGGLTTGEITEKLKPILKRKHKVYRKLKAMNLLNKFSATFRRCSDIDKRILQQNSILQFGDTIKIEGAQKSNTLCFEHHENDYRQESLKTSSTQSYFGMEKKLKEMQMVDNFDKQLPFLDGTKVIDDLIVANSAYLSEIARLNEKIRRLERELHHKSQRTETVGSKTQKQMLNDEKKKWDEQELLPKIKALEEASSRIKDENAHLTERLAQRNEMYAAVREAYDNYMANGENQGYIDYLENHQIEYSLLCGRLKLFKRKYKAVALELSDAKAQLQALAEKCNALISNDSKDSGIHFKETSSVKEPLTSNNDTSSTNVTDNDRIASLEEENAMLKRKLLTSEHDKELLFTQLGRCFLEEKPLASGAEPVNPDRLNPYIKSVIKRLLTERSELNKSVVAKESLLESVQKQYQDSLTTIADLKITINDLNNRLKDTAHAKSLLEAELSKSKQMQHAKSKQKSDSQNSDSNKKSATVSSALNTAQPSLRQGSEKISASIHNNSTISTRSSINERKAIPSATTIPESKRQKPEIVFCVKADESSPQQSSLSRPLTVSKKQKVCEIIDLDEIPDENPPCNASSMSSLPTVLSSQKASKNTSNSREIVPNSVLRSDARTLTNSLGSAAIHLSDRSFYYSLTGTSLNDNFVAVLDDLLKRQQRYVQHITSLCDKQGEKIFVLKNVARVYFDEALVFSERIARLLNLLSSEDESDKRERLLYFDAPLRFSKQLDFYERLEQFNREETFCDSLKKVSLDDAKQLYFSHVMEFNELGALNRRLWLLKNRIKTRKEEMISEIKVMKTMFPEVCSSSISLEPKLEEYRRHSELLSKAVADQKLSLSAKLNSLQEQYRKTISAQQPIIDLSKEQREQGSCVPSGRERLEKLATIAKSEIAKSKKKFLETSDSTTSAYAMTAVGTPLQKHPRPNDDSDESYQTNKRMTLNRSAQKK